MPTKAELEDDLAKAERKIKRQANQIKKLKEEAAEGASDVLTDAVAELIDTIDTRGLVNQADSPRGCIQTIRDNL